MSATEFVERREYLRIPARGSVVVQGGGHEVQGRAVALSATAIEIECELGFALLGMVGQHVTIALHLIAAPEAWRFVGNVKLVRAAAHSIVVTYDPPSPELAPKIEGWLARSSEGVAENQVYLWTRERDHDRVSRASSPAQRRSSSAE